MPVAQAGKECNTNLQSSSQTTPEIIWLKKKIAVIPSMQGLAEVTKSKLQNYILFQILIM